MEKQPACYEQPDYSQETLHPPNELALVRSTAIGNKANVTYNVPMTLQTFQELLRQQPFKPFRLVMSSGETYEVRHPEMAWLTRTDILVGIDAIEDGIPAEFRICSLLHVATIEPLDTDLSDS